jgi:HK97 family phage prohead protease
MKAHRTLHLLAKAPNSKGTFDAVIIHNPADGDKDNERIDNWTNLPGDFPMGYQHTWADPGAVVGKVDVTQHDFRHLIVKGKLDLESPMGRAVHERMLLPSSDPLVLNELSVGFDYDTAANTKDANGVVVIHDAALREVSVVHQGAQATMVQNVKENFNWPSDTAQLRWPPRPLTEIEEINLKLDRLSPKTRQHGTVLFDEALAEGEIDAEDLRLVPVGWHIEERGDSFCVVFEGDGKVVSENATREGARVRLTDLYTEAIAANELKSINARLDEIEKGRPRYTEDVVDEFIREDRAQRERKRAECERQVAWEERMRINMVLDPVPVRVDARMRPVTS